MIVTVWNKRIVLSKSVDWESLMSLSNGMLMQSEIEVPISMWSQSQLENKRESRLGLTCESKTPLLLICDERPRVRSHFQDIRYMRPQSRFKVLQELQCSEIHNLKTAVLDP